MDTLNVWKSINEQLTNFVFSRIKDEDITKDIVQDVFVKVFTKEDTLLDPEKTIAWIYQIARNEVVDHFRKAKVLTLEKDVEIIESPDEPLTSEFTQCLYPLIESLPLKYREALVMADIKQMSQKDIATHLDISYLGAKSRVQRGREMLKATYQQCCTITTDVYGDVLDFKRNGCDYDQSDECIFDCD